METAADPCTVCGGTDSKLIDGFYYCIECGTQNENVREQILEEKALADGTFAQKTKKKIVHVNKTSIEMSGEWYKWHAFNFIISGLADELILLGAKPTFKTKLLWIWTRYIKKYQNKAELMMNETTQDDNNQTNFTTFMVEEDSNPDQHENENEGPDDDINNKNKPSDIIDGSKRDIKFLSKGLIIAMLYTALNLDESDVQLSHLCRFIYEKHLNITNLNRFVPEDINVKKIPQWTSFLRSKLCTHHQIRALGLSLLKKLDLGLPKVPDLRKIVDNFLTELCLPSDMKLLIYSLMHFRKCNFLDIDSKAKKCLIRLPDYEVTVMTYILVAIKICFGLDCDYEFKLSDAVDKINLERDLPKSFKIGNYSDSSDRLFSFREWCNYLQFRKVMLCKFSYRISERNCVDIDDYVYLEHVEDRANNEEKLPDKISMEIIGRLPQEHEMGVISKELFVPTLTPLSEYTDVIIDYCQDSEVKLLLAEDFRRYSLKYACENVELLDSNMDNIMKGVEQDNKTKSKIILGTIVTKKAKTNMVYVKNCENRNWMITNPPTIEHVTCDEIVNDDNDKESDHGYDSENTTKEKNPDSIIDNSFTELRITDDVNTDKSSKCVNKMQIIEEEDADKNIFDDCFEDIDFKEECERNSVIGDPGNTEDNQDDLRQNQFPEEDFDRRSDISVEAYFNPDTFDRDGTIKQLILFACKKYKIPTPAEYRTQEIKKRKERPFGVEGNTSAKRSRKNIYEGKATVQELLSSYYNHLQTDFITKVQQELTFIRNTEHNVDQNNLQVSVVERNATIESAMSRMDSIVSESERNSIPRLTDEQNIDLHVGSQTADKSAIEINETLENTLFEDDNMQLDEVISKGDPKFDEQMYDINQLYIKLKGEEEEEIFDIKDNPEIDEILDKKIEECKHSTKFVKLKAGSKIKDCVKKEEESDSEDEIPLSAIKEEMVQIEELYRQEENYERLIKKVELPEYKYWIRHYDRDFMLRSKDWHTKFDEELKENTPSSFYFVIQECASILNCTNFYLYKNMQVLEEYLMCKARTDNYELEDTIRLLEVMEENQE